jgi:peptidoglycan/LPS O-acetylase OafA/YrhL
MDRRGGGLLVFSAILLGVAGIMRIFDAIWAFRYHGALPQHLEGAIFGTSLKTYGWVYLIVAAVLILCAAALGCISAIWWMPYFPIWSLTYIAILAVVIYALAAYGGGKHEAA